MIYIFSQNDDISTNEVIDWLRYKGVPYTRVNYLEEVSAQALEDLRDDLLSRNYTFGKGNKSHGNSFWFRRPDNRIAEKLARADVSAEDFIYPDFSADSQYFASSVKTNVREYQRTFFESVFLDGGSSVGSFHKNLVNKLDVLRKAEKLEINIPASLVTANVSAVENFLQLHNRDIICKTLYESIDNSGIGGEDNFIYGLTTRVTSTEELPGEFFPSLFQQNIPKMYEIRTFYLKGVFYSAAMFTQNSEKTLTDYRNYDDANPSRMVPYNLPGELEAKLDILMRELDLNTGSIDIIKGKDEEYYFLEVNPVGQFSFVSRDCNYYLEKVIAERLIELQDEV